MNRTWENYINKQKYLDCQIVSAVNAYYYLTGNVIKYNSAQYKHFLDLTSAKNGSAIGIERVYEELGLKWNKDYWHYGELLAENKLPIEINVSHKRHGRHSILIVGYEPKVGAVRVTNFDYETTKDGWIFTEHLDQFLIEAPQIRVVRHIYI